MDSLRQRWDAFTGRERLLIAIMAGLALVVLMLLLVVRPLTAYVASAEPRLSAAERLWAGVQARPISSRGAPDARPLADRVREAAQEPGFELSRVDANGLAGLNVEIAAARAPALFVWLKALEEKGIVATAVKITPRSDATLSVSLTLETRT